MQAPGKNEKMFGSSGFCAGGGTLASGACTMLCRSSSIRRESKSSLENSDRFLGLFNLKCGFTFLLFW
ncbi:MAG: hypothetical protein A3I66_22570 [Burkholderiales bacterium RIFCSPLOWO2_02_FULL_57_36]|nr:MAG: hypothetical protein A3I66_22570 [Burkholderiales bacterium RIFCSPLOWO2_02_FULL_57_36]